MKQYKHNERRTIKVFLVLPRVINGEWHWLVTKSITQKYVQEVEYGYWYDLQWVN